MLARVNPNAGFSRVTVTPAIGFPAASYTVPYTTAFCVAANTGAAINNKPHTSTNQRPVLLIERLLRFSNRSLLLMKVSRVLDGRSRDGNVSNAKILSGKLV